MVLLVVVIAVVLVTYGLVAHQSRRKQFNEVPDLSAFRWPGFGGSRGGRYGPEPWKFIPKPEEVTQEIVERNQAYDATDDLADPRNPGHRAWLEDHGGDATA